jgi:hypothetical protein
MKPTEDKVFVVPFCLSRNTLTKSMASTLAKVKEIYRGQGVVVPFCLSRNILTNSLASTHATVNESYRR